MNLYLQSQTGQDSKFEGEHSSVGLEHLPYKQRVGGSTPSAPTKAETVQNQGFIAV